MWSTTTLATFVNCSASKPFGEPAKVKLAASKKIPDEPDVFVEANASKVDGDVAVNTNEVVCQFRFVNELGWLSLAMPSTCPFAKTATEVGKDAFGFFV